MLNPNRNLALRSLNRVMRSMASTLEANQNLTFLNRTNVNNAPEEEITAKFDGQVYAADIIADDARAVTYEFGRMTLSTDNVPNLKIGIRLTQQQLNFYRRMQERLPQGADEEGIFTDWKNRHAEALLRAIDVRSEALVVAAKLDSAVYDRLGVKFVGSFGMPAALKSTVQTLWSNPASTPITDLQTKRAYAEDNFGRTYDRATLSTREFGYVVASNEFQALASKEFRYTVPTGAITPFSADAPALFEAVTGFQFDRYNFMFREKRPDASTVQSRTLPLGKVLLSNSNDDNDDAVFDLANGIPTETILDELLPNLVEGLNGEQFGPVAYIAPTSADMNPPGMVEWGVARRFPRKNDETETSVLTVA